MYFYRLGGNPIENILSSSLICYYRVSILYQLIFKIKTKGNIILDLTVLKDYEQILFINMIINYTLATQCFLHTGIIFFFSKGINKVYWT